MLHSVSLNFIFVCSTAEMVILLSQFSMNKCKGVKVMDVYTFIIEEKD